MADEPTQDSSSSGTQREPDVALQRSTPNEDATSQRDRAGSETIVHDPEKKRLHEEAITAKKRAKEFEAQLAELRAFKEQVEDSQRSEQEKQALSAKKLQEQLATLQKERDDAISGRRDDRLNYAIQLQAIKHGLNPDASARLLDKSALEFDESGNPKNLDTVFKETVTPYLKPVTQPTSGGATNPSGSQSSTQPLSHDIISKMTGDEYRARRAEIVQWLANNPMPR